MKIKKRLTFLNTMKYKVSISLILIAIIPLLIYMFWSNSQISNKLLDIEKKSMESEIAFTESIFKSEFNELNNLVKDYSIWDEAFNKIEKNDTLWFNINYSSWIAKNYNMDLVAVTDRNMQLIDSFNITNENLNKFLKNDIFKKINSKYYDNSNLGFKVIDNNLYMIAFNPIIKDMGHTNYNGVVVLGKKIDDIFLTNLKNEYNLNIFLSFHGNIASYDENKELALNYMKLNKDDIQNNFIIADKCNMIYKTPIKDLNGENLGYIHEVKSNKPMMNLKFSMQHNGMIVLTCVILLILVLAMFLNKLLVNPIKNLEYQMLNLYENNELVPITTNGPQEILSLSIVFNNLLTKLKTHKKENESLKILSITDELTNVYNHRYFYDYINERITKNSKSITLLLCDIDHFKSINDKHGHLAGDFVLHEIAKLIQEYIGNNGVLFRYGGEEFIVLFENKSMEECFNIAENIRINITKTQNIQQFSTRFPLTISIGIASYPKNASNVEDLVDRADKAMYYSKQNGRNQCKIYTEELGLLLNNTCSESSKKQLLLNAVLSLAAALDAKDIYTGSHSEYVAKYSLLLAEKLNLSEQDKYYLKIGGLLHDCGKIGIPDDVINKSGKLSDEEYNTMKKHPVLGNNIIKYIIEEKEIKNCVLYHHERWDGKGYPEGLKKDEIPFHARIAGIADSYHAMISDRPYRKGLSKEEAFNELRKNSSIQFDPQLVEPFIESITQFDSN